MNTPTKPVKEMSFEDAMTELETLVDKMEGGDIALEDSIKWYERGIELKKHCEAKLKDAQSKIEKISIDEKGDVKTAPLDA